MLQGSAKKKKKRWEQQVILLKAEPLLATPPCPASLGPNQPPSLFAFL